MIDKGQNRQYCDKCIAKFHQTSPHPCQRCTIGADGLPTEYVHEADEEAAFEGRFQPVPTLDLVPRWMHDSLRVGAILEALARYNNANKPVPQEWLDELNEKIKKEEAK